MQNTDEFATSVTYTATGASPVTIIGTFDPEEIVVDPFDPGEQIIIPASIEVITTDVPNLAQYDKFTINSVTYVVKKFDTYLGSTLITLYQEQNIGTGANLPV
jgi:hypothetical protein